MSDPSGHYWHDAPVHWHTPVAFPCSTVRDPRTGPGALALLFALHVVCMLCETHECSVPNDRLMQLTGFRSRKSLYKHRRELERWGYAEVQVQIGLPTDYVCPALSSSDNEVAIPAAVALDPRCRSGHVATYLALSVLAQETRLAEQPLDAEREGRHVDPSRASDPPPLFPQHTQATNQQLMELTGFSTLRPLRRYRTELAAWSFIQSTVPAGGVTEYELTASIAAQQDLEQRLAALDDSPQSLRSGARNLALFTQPPYRQSPASAILAREGVLLRDLAQILGLPVAEVSMQLAGLRSLHPRLLPTLRALAGAQTGTEIQKHLRRAAPPSSAREAG